MSTPREAPKVRHCAHISTCINTECLRVNFPFFVPMRLKFTTQFTTHLPCFSPSTVRAPETRASIDVSALQCQAACSDRGGLRARCTRDRATLEEEEEEEEKEEEEGLLTNNVYVCMYVCIYMCIYMYVYVCIYIYIVCVCVCVHARKTRLIKDHRAMCGCV